MREVTSSLIKNFEIYRKGVDFMGYKVYRNTPVDFHHALVSRRECKRLGMGDGYTYENGVILCHNSSHPYLHVIEVYEPEMFSYITSEMYDMKVKGYLDGENLREISKVLKEFEHKHYLTRTSRGKLLIKDEYLKRMY